MNTNKVINLEQKTCSKCKESKFLAEFDRHGYSKSGYRSACKSCTSIDWKQKHREFTKNNPEEHARRLEAKRKYHYSERNYNKYFIRTYGITYAEVRTMYDAQFGRCANRGCGKEISFYSENKDGLKTGYPPSHRACIDHDHETGRVRGLLCRPCNVILGTLESQENIVLGLMEYKIKHKQ